jgi:hypothetical protein
MTDRPGMPLCESCGREPAVSFSWFADRERWYAPRSGRWRFVGACTSEVELYYIAIHGRGRGFLDSATSRERWLAHLEEKTWFDRADFFAMLARFEAAGGSLRLAVPHRKGRYGARLRANTKPVLRARELPQLDVVPPPR